LEWSVVIPVGVLLGASVASTWRDFQNEVLRLGAWVPIVFTADLMPVTLWGSIELTMSLPILLAAAFVFPPPLAGLLGYAGTLDVREFRREITILRGFFNRSQIALSVFAASLVFQDLGGSVGNWPLVVMAGFAALVADMVVNNGLTIIGFHLLTKEPLHNLVRNIYGRGRPLPFLLGYACFGLLAVLLATVYSSAAEWGLIAFVIPVFLARQMFERDRQLLEASDALAVKERLLLTVSERIAEERRDERLSVAAGLHDEVLPPLYKVHLLGQVLRQELADGRLLELEGDLPGLVEATSRASEAIRVLIGGLRHSPLGPRGAPGTLLLLARQLETESRTRFELRVGEVAAAPLIQLLAYQVAREAMVNAVRHSGAETVRVVLMQDDRFVRLVVEDDGSGFDPSRVDRGSHFGLQLMKERVELVGGVFQLVAMPGHGTQIVARLPAEILV
jgi:signal transduction histidine kinase